MAKTTKKGGAVKVEKQPARALLLVDPDLHRRLKVYAAQHGTNVKALVAEALTAYLDNLEKGGTRDRK
jgi:plasmid stability protein